MKRGGFEYFDHAIRWATGSEELCSSYEERQATSSDHYYPVIKTRSSRVRERLLCVITMKWGNCGAMEEKNSYNAIYGRKEDDSTPPARTPTLVLPVNSISAARSRTHAFDAKIGMPEISYDSIFTCSKPHGHF